ncbi:MAG: gliding motility-associated ABC transporter ATP-binding subunit GldA [Bacteroidales bacterium]|nr:gliding motility-associated ABC transporter ATP-binding subunit GldA [Bacteroidales bacterium]
MSIQVEHVTKKFGIQKALDDVSFTAERGEILGFLGPNGAGKSTMMKIITGYLSPDNGNVLVCGHDVAREQLEARRKIGYLPENNPLYHSMYVREYLSFVAGIYFKSSDIRKRVEQIIERTGLSPEQHKQIGMLSKGYRQRVGLAQALLHDPEVLILDEPTSGLDPNQIVEIRHLISELSSNKTVLLSTHIMQEVEAICHRIIIINRGKLAAEGDTSAMLSESSPGQQTLLLELNGMISENDLLSVPGVSAVKNVGNYRWIISGTTEPDIRTTLFAFAVEHGLVVLSLQRKEKNLEEVFREITNN